MPGAPVFLPAIRSRQHRHHKVNMARGAESNLACGWLLLATCVRGAQSEKSCLGGAGAFLLGGDTPFSLERKWGSHKWGVPLTPPKELKIHSPSFILPTHNPVLKRTPNWVLPVKSREILSTGRSRCSVLFRFRVGVPHTALQSATPLPSTVRSKESNRSLRSAR